MAATQAKSGYLTKLEIGNEATPTEAFIEVGELVDVGELTQTLNMIDATHMQSPDAHDESIPTFKSTGNLTLSLNYVPTNTGFLECREALNDRELRNFRLTLPPLANRRFDFKAYVVTVAHNAPHDDKMAATVELDIQGKPIELQADGTALP
jgi:hypothetical protein